MIIFIDDEHWVIEGYIDRFNSKKKEDARYENKHFFYPKEAWPFIRRKFEEIELIILDIALDYGDGNILNEIDGGIQFLKEIRNERVFDKIPILIYSVIQKDKVQRDSGLKIGVDTNIGHLNRDCKDDDFYKLVEILLRKKNLRQVGDERN